MKFTEIISIAGYAIEAIGVFVVFIGSVISTIAFIRTFLSVTLHLEVEGRWPWQQEEKNDK
jgi:hypothetical protein